MRWDVRGVDRETEAEVELQVEAKSQSEAIAKGREAGVLVKSAWPIRPPLSPVVDRPATRTVAPKSVAPKLAQSLLPTDDDLEAIAAAAETAHRTAWHAPTSPVAPSASPRVPATAPAPVPAATPPPVPLSLAPPPVPVVAARQAEIPILQTPPVTVTSARIIIGDTTYAVASVTSVQPRFIPTTRVTESLTLVAGVTFVLFGYAVSRQPPGPAAVQYAVAVLYAVGALCLLAAFLAWRRNRPKYAVRLASPSGERDVLVSEDHRWIKTVVRAINQAIASRR